MNNIEAKDFNAFIQSDFCVVQFSATWCGPCKALTTVLDSLSNDMTDVPFGKVDIDDCQEISQKFGIRSVPTVVCFQRGVEVERTLGMKSRNVYEDFISKARTTHV